MVENSETKSIMVVRRSGGFKATKFIFLMLGLENMAFVASASTLVLYFLTVMHYDLSTSSTHFSNAMGTTFLLSLLGGFISDTYVTRLNTCLIFGLIEVLGYMLLTIQAHYPALQPKGKTERVEGGKAFMFYTSIYLIALGAGGTRGSLPALGADQYDHKNPKERKQLGSFFNWLLLSITTGATIGVTIIVWLSMNKGWDVGFFISMVAVFVSLVFITLGKPYYRVRIPGDSPLIRVIQVFVAAFRNRKLLLPENSNELYEIHDKEAALEERQIPHTNQFKFFDKAAVLHQGSKPEPWRICSVTQVEEVKILTRMIPIIASTIIMNTCLAQLQTFSVLQGSMMNNYLGSFPVPTPSIPVIPLIFMSILIPIYEFVFVPFARKITGHPTGITHLQRAGIGLVLSAVSMAIAGMIEVKRRDAFNQHGDRISIFWLSFHYAIFGIADMFTLVGLMEFFYSEAPLGMRSLSTSFTFLSLSIGFYLNTVFVELVNSVTSKLTKSKQGWLYGDNLNKNNLNLFYLFLAVLSCINFFNYLYWASWYKNNPAVHDHEKEGKLLTEASSKKETTEEQKSLSPIIDKECIIDKEEKQEDVVEEEEKKKTSS